ncbi:MAG TPA: Nramp family divalent metal transporter [Armatimonadota bacterium]
MKGTIETNRAATIAQPGPPGARVVRTNSQRRLLTFLMVAGPGLIVMASDNDAGAVSTYIQAGAQYGLHLLWLVAVLLPITYFVQEMVVRLGIVTGQGHAAMIYRRFGKWWGVFSLGDLLLVNFLTLVTEFACIALASDALGLSPYVGVPLAAGALMALVLTGSYRKWERATVLLCALDLLWLGLAFVWRTPAREIVKGAFVPSIPAGGITGGLLFIIIAIVGTTIAPWQLFFQQSCVADKKLRRSQLGYARLDTFVGAIVVITVAAGMMLAGNASRERGIAFTDPGQMAVALAPHFGQFVKYALLMLMVNAAVLGATSISLASSWAYGEVKGWPSSLQMRFREAPRFYGFYIVTIAIAGGLVLIPRAPLQLIILSVQVLAGIMLPSAIVFLQLLLNDRELMTDQFVNRPWNNWVNWTIITVLFALSMILAAQVLLPKLFASA